MSIQLPKYAYDVLDILSTVVWKDTFTIRDEMAAKWKQEGRKPYFAARLLSWCLQDPEMAYDNLGTILGTLPLLHEEGLVEERIVPRTSPFAARFPNKQEWRLTQDGVRRRLPIEHKRTSWFDNLLPARL